MNAANGSCPRKKISGKMIDPQLGADRPDHRREQSAGDRGGDRRALAAQGARIFLTSFRPYRPGPRRIGRSADGRSPGPAFYAAMQQQPPELVADIESRGGRPLRRNRSLASGRGVRFVRGCEEKLGPPDILVINHAHWQPDTFDPGLSPKRDSGSARRPEPSWTPITRSTPGRRRCSWPNSPPEMRGGTERGRIIAVSTDAADAHASAASYAASKHALESYSRTAAYELGKYGITVNIVAPGPVQTGWLTPDEERDIGRRTPLGRTGKPEDIADVIVFLASEQARWLTGQLIYAGGGWKMSL